MTINANLLIKNVIQIKSFMTINVNVSVNIKKNLVHVKNIMIGILPFVFESNYAYMKTLTEDSVVTCDEIKVVDKSYNDTSRYCDH